MDNNILFGFVETKFRNSTLYMSKIPELSGPPECYYNIENAQKYDNNTRIQSIQREIALRCIELLDLKSNGLILDIGCGTGISGNVLSETNLPWIGIDVSSSMLDICLSKAECIGAYRGDIGEGLSLKPGIFDGVISVSAIQWLLQSYKSSHVPKKRIRQFFTDLYSVCKPDATCVLQFYLKNKKEIELLQNEALRAGFYGGIQIDKPNTKHTKQYLVLQNTCVRTKSHKQKKQHKRIKR